MNNLVSSTDVVISLLSPFHVIYEFIECCWEQIPAQIPVERRAEIAPSPAKSRSGVGMPAAARGVVEFIVISLWCFGTLVNTESM